jgi:hypothetical protein
MRTVLATNDNTIEVLLFARSEIPEAKKLQRALERVIEDGLDAEESTTAAAPVSTARGGWPVCQAQ